MWSFVSGRWNAVRGAAVVATMLSSSGAVASPAVAKSTLAGWYLTEAADATSVWIAPRESTIAYCNRLRVRRLKVTETQVRLQLEATPKSSDPCPTPDVLRAPDRIRVRVPGGIDGRRITGPRTDRKPIDPMFWNEWHVLKDEAFKALAAPRLIGLSAKDAAALLARIGVAASATATGPRNGEVTQQTPAPGEAFLPETAAFSLTTR